MLPQITFYMSNQNFVKLLYVFNESSLDLGILGREFHHLHRLLPYLACLFHVHSGSTQCRLLAVHEVFARDIGHLIGCGQIDGGLGARLGRLEEALGDGHHGQIEGEGHIAPNARVNHARMQKVDCDIGALQALGQLAGKVDVGKLGHVVQVGGREGANGIQLVHIDRSEAIQLRGDNNNA